MKALKVLGYMALDCLHSIVLFISLIIVKELSEEGYIKARK